MLVGFITFLFLTQTWVSVSDANVDVIKKVHTFNTIKNEIKYSPEDTVIFLDIDDVIITPTDDILKSCGGKNPFKVIKFFHQKIALSLPTQVRDYYLERLGTLYLSRKVELTELDLDKIVQTFILEGYTVIGITGVNLGKCGRISSIQDWRVSELANFGITFDPQLDWHNEKDSFDCIYNSGIIFAGSQPKARCISMILRKNPKFKNIILVDDQIGNLKNTASMLSKLQLNFQGFHYVGAKDKPCKLDLQVADFQWLNLMENNVWLSDMEVKKSRYENKN